MRVGRQIFYFGNLDGFAFGFTVLVNDCGGHLAQRKNLKFEDLLNKARGYDFRDVVCVERDGRVVGLAEEGNAGALLVFFGNHADLFLFERDACAFLG